MLVGLGIGWSFWRGPARALGRSAGDRDTPRSRRPRTTQFQPAKEPSIAVLPFVNMSSDKEQEYFSDGITEELINLLAKVPSCA